MRWIELKVPPLIVWLSCVGAMGGLARVMPGCSVSLAGSTEAGNALAAVGVAVAAAGAGAFRRNRTTLNPLTPGAASCLVVSGIYRLSRNPMYLGFLIVLVGWAVHLSNLAAAALLPVFIGYMNRYQIKPEERALLAKFGPEFADYLSRVRRWL